MVGVGGGAGGEVIGRARAWGSRLLRGGKGLATRGRSRR